MPAKPNQPPEPSSEPVQVSEEYKDLMGELERSKVAWRPEPGDAVAGKVLAIFTAESEFGAYPLITLDPGGDSPLVDVHCFHIWLKSDIARLQVREGDTLGVKFVDRNGPREAARYRTTIRRTGAGEPYDAGATAKVSTAQVEQLFEEPF